LYNFAKSRVNHWTALTLEDQEWFAVM
jgi:hypothetical protein